MPNAIATAQILPFNLVHFQGCLHTLSAVNKKGAGRDRIEILFVCRYRCCRPGIFRGNGR
jgi:hypothetical protein